MLSKDPDIPTVKLTDLIKDGCNYQDNTFEQFVRDFMQRNMPGFPLGLLQTEGDDAYERWEIEPEDRFVVKKLKLTIYTCSACCEEYSEWGVEGLGGVCCPLESLADAEEAEEDEEEYEPLESEVRTYTVIQDDHYADGTYTDDGDEQIEVDRGVTCWGWVCDADGDDDGLAEQKAQDMNHENQMESGHGFPWANNWCFLPDDYIETQDLKDAGFTVADYTGGQGDSRNDSTYRLAGIDGGGYNFSCHFSKLCALHYSRKNWTVETDDGPCYITCD